MIRVPETERLPQLIIAQEVPAEVMDPGTVRMGGAIKFCWLGWEIMQYFSALSKYWTS